MQPTKRTNDIATIGALLLTMLFLTCPPLQAQWKQDAAVSVWDDPHGPTEEWACDTIDAYLKDATGVFAGDLDGDGDPDLAATSWSNNTIVWYENPRVTGTWERRFVDDYLRSAIAVQIADIDGDGDLDIIAAGYHDHVVNWYENQLPDGAWTKHQVGKGLSGVSQIWVADIDGDGDNDVAATAGSGYKVAWYENSGTVPVTWTEWTVSDSLTGPRKIHVADVDQDGHMDLVVASEYRNSVTLFLQNPGSPITWTAECITDNLKKAIAVDVEDIDQDGDMDVAAVGYAEDKVYWFEQTGGESRCWTPHVVAEQFPEPRNVLIEFMRVTGTPAILATSYADHKVKVWEMWPDVGWREMLVDSNLYGARAMCTADIDGDDFPDIVALGQSSNDVLWYDNNLFSVDEHIDSEGAAPATCVLHQNSPNPFSRMTRIDYDLRISGNVLLTVHDVLGRKIQTLIENRQDAGAHAVQFLTHELPSGLYFYRLRVGDAPAQTRRMSLMK